MDYYSEHKHETILRRMYDFEKKYNNICGIDTFGFWFLVFLISNINIYSFFSYKNLYRSYIKNKTTDWKNGVF